jgi:V/A-type H+-transporting ATPase subunit K
MNKQRLMRRLGLSLVIFGMFVIGMSLVGPVAAQDHDTSGEGDLRPLGIGLLAIGAGIAIGLAGYATGKAQADIGAAAVGAVAEDPNMFGRGLILTVIPETIVIFGLVVALILMFVTVGQI